MHGTVGADGKQTLAMRTTKDDADMSTPEEVGNVIKASRARVKSIMLNIWQGRKRESVEDFIGGTDYVVGWKTDVADSAAVQFSEQFYGSIEDGDSVEVAYFHAIENMKSIYRWQVRKWSKRRQRGA